MCLPFAHAEARSMWLRLCEPYGLAGKLVRYLAVTLVGLVEYAMRLGKSAP